jgi:hypothetical protein
MLFILLPSKDCDPNSLIISDLTIESLARISFEISSAKITEYPYSLINLANVDLPLPIFPVIAILSRVDFDFSPRALDLLILHNQFF